MAGTTAFSALWGVQRPPAHRMRASGILLVAQNGRVPTSGESDHPACKRLEPCVSTQPSLWSFRKSSRANHDDASLVDSLGHHDSHLTLARADLCHERQHLPLTLPICLHYLTSNRSVCAVLLFPNQDNNADHHPQSGMASLASSSCRAPNLRRRLRTISRLKSLRTPSRMSMTRLSILTVACETSSSRHSVNTRNLLSARTLSPSSRRPQAWHSSSSELAGVCPFTEHEMTVLGVFGGVPIGRC